MREKNVKPLLIYKAGLSGRYYATRSVKQLSPMHMVCTGKKEDVTDQIEALFADRASVTADPRVAELEAALRIYADEENWTDDKFTPSRLEEGCRCFACYETYSDRGNHARAALAGSAAQTATEPQEAV